MRILNHVLSWAAIGASAAIFQASAMCHDQACSTMVTREFGYISPGLSWVNTDNLNDQLGLAGISPFRTLAPTLSLGGHKEMKRLIMESSITGRYWHDNVNGNLRTSLMISDITWNSGFSVLPSGLPVTLYPLLGLGVGLNSIRIRSDEKLLADVIAAPATNVHLMQAAFLLNAGGGMDFRIPTMKDGKAGLVLGLRGGYLFDPFTKDRDWYSDMTAVEDVPALHQSGGYIRLVVGGWGEHQHYHHMH